MRHRQIRKELEKNIRSVIRKGALPIVLRDYQRETLINTANWLRNARGSRAAYVQHPTGSGKTVLFATMVSSAKNLRCLVVVPNKLLVSQTVQEIVKFTKHSVGHVSSLGKIHDDKSGELIAMRGTEGQRIVVTTDASFKIHAKKLAREFGPHIVIRDECHWSYTERSQQATRLFPEAVVIGYSATPDYLTTIAKPDYIPVTLDNGQVLYVPPSRMARTYYPTLLDQRTLRWAIEREYLSPLAWGFLEFDASLDGVSVVDGPNGPDYDAEELAKLMEEHWSLLEEVICRLYQDNAYGIRKRQVCAICPSVAQAESLAKKIAKYVPAACVSGATLNEDRDEILQSFDSDRPSKKDIRFVSSVFVLREGWNARNAEIALMLRPTKSRTLYEQFMGRIMRLRRDGKKKISLVLDLLFTGTKLAPLNAPALYGVPGEKIREGGILIAPKRKGKKVRITSPYLPKHVRPRIRVVKTLDIDRWVGDDGFLTFEEELWGTVRALVDRLGIGQTAIANNLKGCRFRKGRSRSGLSVSLYSLKDVKDRCKRFLTSKVSKDGFLRADGEEWGTLRSLAKRIGISDPIVKIRSKGSRTRLGRDARGASRKLFCYRDVAKRCRELTFPQVSKDGFLCIDGDRWTTMDVLAEFFSVSPELIKKYGAKCSKRRGRSKRGHAVTLYSLKGIQGLLHNHLQPKVGGDGLLREHGVWGSLRTLASELKISPAKACAIVRRYPRKCRFRNGRSKGGNKLKLYSLEDLKRLLPVYQAKYVPGYHGHGNGK